MVKEKIYWYINFSSDKANFNRVKDKKEKNNKKWWGLIVLALVLRLIIGSLSYHTDIKAIYRDAGYVKTGVISGYLQAITDKSPLPYPPVTYMMFNGHQKIGKLWFSSYFETWMQDWGALHTVNHPQIFRDLWAMKLPMFIADILVAWLIYKMVKKRKFEAVSLWLLNPFSLYSIYAIGQFDIIPTALMLAGLWLWRDKKKNWAYACIGIGAGFKLFPLLMLPVLWMKDERKLKERIMGVSFGLGAFLLMLSPILKSVEVIRSVFLSNLTSGVFQATISLGKSESLPIYIVLYLGILLWTGPKDKKENGGWEVEMIAVYGLLFGLSHFHPQWITWIIPFLVLGIAEKKFDWRSVGWLMMAYLGTILLIDDKFVALGQLKAVNNSFDTLPTIRWIFDRMLLGDKLQMLAHAGVLVGVIALLIQGWKNIKVKINLPEIKIVKMSVIWGASLIILFLVAHLPISRWGRYIDANKMNPQETIVLSNKIVFKEKLEVNRNYFRGIELRIKNIDLRTQTDLLVRITDGKEKIIEEQRINGQEIGDDFNLKVMFNSPKDISTEEEWWIEISSPQALTDKEFKLGVINKENLAYTTYFNPGGWKENVIYSLGNIIGKL